MREKEKEIPTFNFDYEITYSKRKNLSIYIKSGKADVRAPKNSSILWINEFLVEKSSWIEQKIAEQRGKDAQKLKISDGLVVPFFGEPRKIRVIVSSTQKVEIDSDHLYLYIRDNTPEKLEKLFNRWLMDQAREYMTTQTIKIARQLGMEDKLKEVVFRKTKTKWGHCCHDGTIQYNWLTMMAPKAVIDYLIAHESSHLVHMNHSKSFWQTVATVCPDYKNLKGWLKDNGHRLWS